MATKVKVGVIGCGNISPAYFQGCAEFEILDVVACADLDLDRARQRAEEFGVPKACTVEEILGDPDIQIVINITIPGAHSEVNIAILEAGKNAHTEKPFAVYREGGKKALEAAEKAGLLVGGAPDTFLGGGIQTCRKLIDDGWIGQPVAATAFLAGPGHERWHPDPQFFYKVGGGPMFDMGPYYLTALVNLLGPIRRVTGSAKITRPERVVTSEPKYGEIIQVETPTHIAGVLDFESGVVGTILTSFDVWAHHLPRIEIYGTEGSLSVPDPNTFRGPVSVRRANAKEWQEIPLTHSDEVKRGIGVADMAYALRSGRPHRVSGALAYHVLDVMCASLEASESGSHIEIQSSVERPAPLPLGLLPGTLDE